MGRHWDDNTWDERQYAFWEQSVRNAARGKRGQRFLRELREALLALPERRLASHTPVNFEDGQVCLVSAYVAWRLDRDRPTAPETLAEVRRLVLAQAGVDPATIDDWSWQEDDQSRHLTDAVTALTDVPECLIEQLQYENDEGWVPTKVGPSLAEQRWAAMLRYVESLLKPPLATT